MARRILVAWFAMILVSCAAERDLRPASKIAPDLVATTAVRSATNNPRVLEARVERDRDRLRFEARLRYANRCYAAAGAEVVLVPARDARTWLEIRQRTPRDGCPELHRPVVRVAEATLPLAVDSIVILDCCPEGDCSASSTCHVEAQPVEPRSKPEYDQLKVVRDVVSLPPVDFVEVVSSTRSDGRTRITIVLDSEIDVECAPFELVLSVLESRIERSVPIVEWGYLSVGAADGCPRRGRADTLVRVRIHRDLRSDSTRTLELANPGTKRSQPPNLTIQLVDPPR